MASLIYDSYFDDLNRGNIVPSTDTFYGMLVTDAYVPNKGTHTKRSDVTNEVSGTGYTANGKVVSASVSVDTTNHRSDVTFVGPSWAASTLTARGIVIYKYRGGVASNDNLVAYVDFGSNISSSGATFQVTFTSPLRIQN